VGPEEYLVVVLSAALGMLSPNQWLMEVSVWAFTFVTATIGAFFQWLASLVR
jgi:hypothetical protein